MLEIEGMNADDVDKFVGERINIMNNNNPCFVLRNWIAQEAIAKAEKDDFSRVTAILERLKVILSHILWLISAIETL